MDYKRYMGCTFGSLTVIDICKKVYKDKRYSRPRTRSMFKCRCSCGFEKLYRVSDILKSRKVKCRRCDRLDLYPVNVGERYGKLVVTAVDLTSVGAGVRVECLCDCGNTKVFLRKNLVNGSTYSCGCERSNLASDMFSSGEFRKVLKKTRNDRVDANKNNSTGIKNVQKVVSKSGNSSYLVKVIRNGVTKRKQVRTLDEALRVKARFLEEFSNL